MVIKTRCASCGAGLAAPAEKAGARLKCPKCGSPVEVPKSSSSSPTTPAAQRRPAAAAPVAANIDLEDLPGGADLSAFDRAGNTDPFSSAMNLTAGATLGPMSNTPLGGPPKRAGGLFGLEPWVWMIIAGSVSAVVMIGLLAIAKWKNSGESESPAPEQVAAAKPDGERALAPPRPASGKGGSSNVPLITSTKMPQPIADAYASVVMITPYDANASPLPHGTGFVANEAGLIATSHHILAKAHSARVLFNNGETFEVTGYRGIDTEHDLAVLELSSLPSKFSAVRYVADESLQPRIRVYSIGHPEPSRYIIESGLALGVMTADQMPATVRVNHPLPPESIWIQTDANVAGDAGGGPLINETGEVVGVASFQVTTAGKTTGYAAMAYYLEALLNSLTEQATPLQPAESSK